MGEPPLPRKDSLKALIREASGLVGIFEALSKTRGVRLEVCHTANVAQAEVERILPQRSLEKARDTTQK